MAAILPLPYIIFFLATVFLPPGTTKFSAELGHGLTVSWTHQADGWHAETAGHDAGVWTVDGLVVAETSDGRSQKTDLTEYVTVENKDGSEKAAAVNGKPVEVKMTDTT
ncbi:MAG: hypothetical protein M3Y86_11950, partial [Verrucomicrobiota bacterium]|nr:hypothetical protein [Verrucomicrobiota bacterium]